MKRENNETQMAFEQANNDQKSSTTSKALTLKNLIADILISSTAYDCMPINSAMCSIDKSVNLVTAINIFINEGVDELLVWDENESKWVWMMTLADIIRFISYGLKCVTKGQTINFERFEMGQPEEIPEPDKPTLERLITEFKAKSLSEIFSQFQRRETGVNRYIRLKSVVKQAQLSYIIVSMIYQKIHRILIEDGQSGMMISIINFKDILLFLLRIANQSSVETYSKVPIKSFLDKSFIKDKFIFRDQKAIEAFRLMSETYKSLWINVVDRDMQFCGILFRRDFKEVLKGWNLSWLWMTVGELMDKLAEKNKSRIPQYRFFDLEDTTKEILWKIVMSSRNVIVCLDKQTNHVIATIGLMELFNLYVSAHEEA